MENRKRNIQMKFYVTEEENIYPGTASGEPEHQPNCKTRQCDGDSLQAGHRGH